MLKKPQCYFPITCIIFNTHTHTHSIYKLTDNTDYILLYFANEMLFGLARNVTIPILQPLYTPKDIFKKFQINFQKWCAAGLMNTAGLVHLGPHSAHEQRLLTLFSVKRCTRGMFPGKEKNGLALTCLKLHSHSKALRHLRVSKDGTLTNHCSQARQTRDIISKRSLCMEGWDTSNIPTG